MSWDASRWVRALADGNSADAKAIRAAIGGKEFEELSGLQRKAARKARRGGPRVYLLPGIMGSSLGTRDGDDADVIWIDLIDVLIGHLDDISLDKGGDPAVTSVGVRGMLWKYYAKLNFALEEAGYDVVIHDFDWRKSLPSLGAILAERIKKDPASEILIAAHSMGGLVSRAALTDPAVAAKVKRLVMMGTPNHGSFSPVVALRGQHDVARLMSKIDLTNSQEDLVKGVFSSFPGLYEMIPEQRGDMPDFFDLAGWPVSGLQPRKKILEAAKNVQRFLATTDCGVPFHLIAGVNQKTKVAARLKSDRSEFVYTESREGDGTVPLDFARLDGTPTVYVEEEHGALPENALVGAAVIEFFQTGATRILPSAWSGARSATEISESEIAVRDRAEARRTKRCKPGQLALSEYPGLVRSFLASSTSRDVVQPAGEVVAAAGVCSLDGIVVGRRKYRQLEIELTNRSITDVSARACVLGIFENVEPAGAAAAVDERMNGALSDLIQRRMFSARVGGMFPIPATRHNLPCDLVLLAGLGAFDRFNDEAQRLVAENVIRVLVAGNIEEFACVLLGSSATQRRDQSLRNMLQGFLGGLADADDKQRFRRVIICETDPQRLQELREALYRETATDLFLGVEVEFREDIAETTREASAPARAAAAAIPASYLMVRQFDFSPLKTAGSAKPGKRLDIQTSLMGPTSRAAIGLTTKSVGLSELDDLLARIEGEDFDAMKLGPALASLLFTDEMKTALLQTRDAPLVVVHDGPASRIPWELIALDGWRPALDRGLTRRYLAANLAVAKWQAAPQKKRDLRMLLVVNPTGDLPGAAAEGRSIQKIVTNPRPVVIEEGEATRDRLLAELASGNYDVMHYAGHAFFEADNPGSCGLLCAGDRVLTGPDVAAIRSLPALIVCNACESGRIRRRNGKSEDLSTKKARGWNKTRAIEQASLAESLMRNGLLNFLGTYWPVGDQPALTFATNLYASLLAGDAIGHAVLKSRNSIARRFNDWADYIFYGDPSFRLKPPPG